MDKFDSEREVDQCDFDIKGDEFNLDIKVDECDFDVKLISVI